MENVGWFFDHASGSNVLAHQSVTSVLYDIETGIFYPFLTRLYIKKIQSGEEMIRAWSITWPIEDFHKDAKSLGLGE
ncbi:hypothetical protein [Acidiplasma aeolicum]|jgi:hypothetical protein|uniref:hypothetical protein n=1 Tax=Acidiplasma aeolicum TaxID=507754 RepID=UPI0037205A4D